MINCCFFPFHWWMAPLLFQIFTVLEIGYCWSLATSAHLSLVAGWCYLSKAQCTVWLEMCWSKEIGIFSAAWWIVDAQHQHLQLTRTVITDVSVWVVNGEWISCFTIFKKMEERMLVLLPLLVSLAKETSLKLIVLTYIIIQSSSFSLEAENGEWLTDFYDSLWTVNLVIAEEAAECDWKLKWFGFWQWQATIRQGGDRGIMHLLLSSPPLLLHSFQYCYSSNHLYCRNCVIVQRLLLTTLLYFFAISNW